jgi:uncharacterized protein with FMN-binding domain
VRKFALFLVCMLSIFSSRAQSIENVADLTLKIASLKEEELYFRFAAGDKIILNVKEESGKEISEIEVLEYPDIKRFSTRKSSVVKDQEIQVNSNAVYVFRLKNTALNRRDCKVRIDRIPAKAETSGFNTSVSWVTVNDTTWKTSSREGIIRYDTTLIPGTKRGIIKEETVEELVLDKNQRLHAKANLKSVKSTLSFSLPKDQISPQREKKLVSWAYWVGVDEAGNKAWEQNSKIITKVVKGGASILLTPLGALAVGVVADLSIPTMGEDVEYWITDKTNAALFKDGKAFKFKDHGKGVAGYQKFNGTAERDFSILLKNDNLVQGIDVNLKIVAIYKLVEYGNVPHTETKITPVKGKIQERTPIIKQIRKPLMGN